MALLKLCRCGKKIDYNIRYCDRCTIAAEEYHRAQAQRYDRRVRNNETNKRYTSFYNSKAWRTLSHTIRDKYSGVCVVCMIESKEVTKSDTTHHIVELKEDWSLRLVEDNLVPLCHECHNKLHAHYTQEDKASLRNIIKRYKNKFNI